MSKPHFREITEYRLSEDYDHEIPLDFNLVRSNAHLLANQEFFLTKKNSLYNWDKYEKESTHYLPIKNDLNREIALIKLLFSTKKNFLLKKNVYKTKSLVEKYFQYLNSNEIWSLMCKKTICGNTLYQCINQINENIFGFKPLDGECYTKFKILLWPCIMDYYQIDIHTLPIISYYNYDNIENLNKFLVNYSYSIVKLFSIVAIRNINNYSFKLSSKYNHVKVFINQIIKDTIKEYQGQYITTEYFTNKHLQILANSMVNKNCTLTPEQYPDGLYISSDESLLIWVMGNDHFRIISLSTTLNISNVYKNLNTYLIFIDNYLLQENYLFAFHSKFSYLTSSIDELSGLIIIMHCTIFNEYHEKFLENQLEKVQEHLCYSKNSFESSTMIITNRPLLGLNNNEKLLRTIYSILIVLNNSR